MGLVCSPFYSFPNWESVTLCWTVFSSVSAVHGCVYDTDAKGIVDLFSRRIFAVRSSRIVLFVMKTVDLVVSHCV